MFTEKHLTEDKFKNLFSKNLKDYAIYDLAVHVIDDAKKMCEDNLNLINSIFENICLNSFESHINSIQGITLLLEKATIEIIGGKTEYSTISEPSFVFKENFNEQQLILKQIIIFDDQLCFAMLSNNIDKTHVIRFNYSRVTKENFDITQYNDADLFIAWGSSANKYILFEKINRKAFSASLIEGKRFSTRGQPIEIYKHINQIKTAAYTQKSRKLFIISDEGFLYYKEMVGEEMDLIQVKRRVDDPSSEIPQYAPLLSSNGMGFIELDISEDESTLFLSSTNLVECYNCNFELLLKIEIRDLLFFKTVMCERSIYMNSFLKDTKFICHKITIPREERQIHSTANLKMDIPGNPIIDVWHHGITKFGPQTEITQVVKGSRKIGYFTLAGKVPKIEAYFKNLKKVNECYKFIGLADPTSKLFKKNEIKKSLFLYALWTRNPLHLASIQQNNLIPLQNGKNNFDEFSNNSKNSDFMEEFVNYIKLGHFEEILEKLNDIIIISIIGRQSSGKSYLLNRLTGSRFDVAAEKCTDGIWMAVAKIDDKDIIIFDCEGLFTIERSTQEEVKLCLFLTSLSDILILNGDLSSAKNVKELFDEFSRGVGRLKGKDLFKAKLDITYRDIPDNQTEDARKEFRSFVAKFNYNRKRRYP